MENEVEVIKSQMTETRTALTEKLEALGQQVSSTVQDTTQTVAETVGTVKDTVESTVSAVSESVAAVKETFNLASYVEKYPWLVMGGSIVCGYLIGGACSSTSSSNSSAFSSSPPPAPAEANRSQPKQEDRKEDSQAEAAPSLMENWEPVVEKLKGLALGVSSGVLGELLLASVPTSWKSDLSQVVDDLTKAMGGQVLRKSSDDKQPAKQERT